MDSRPPGPGGGHYFDPQPAAASRPSTVTLDLPDVHLVLATDTAVFAREQVDPGTKLLLLDAPPPVIGARNVLDLGCGYGPIAVTLAHRAPEAIVWAVDVNERALDLCRENAVAADVGDRVHAVTPDAVPDDVAFDGIWSNPPIRIGKPALHALLVRWLDRLAGGAPAHLVVQKHLGSDSLARWLGDQGFEVERIGSRMGYRLLTVRTRG